MSATEPTASPARRRRSEATKDAILSAARRRFVTDGYERATIRAIAADAHIDPAMVMRYFGSKEQLFSEATRYDLRLPDLSAIPRDQVGERLVRHLLELWEDDRVLAALLRSSVASEEAAAERIRGIFTGQVLTMIAPLFDGDVERAAPRAGLAVSQILGLVLCRYILRLPPVVALSGEEIVAWLGPTLQRYLTEPG